MSVQDFQKVEKEFEALKKKTASKLTALIDKRLAIIRQAVPNAEYSDAMGTSFFYTKGHGSNTDDPMYIASDYLQGEMRPPTEEEYGEPLPPHLVQAKDIFERYGEVMSEVFEIAMYLYDKVGYTYS